MLMVSGCAPLREMRGDELLRNGRTTEAIAEWDAAMNQQVMDFELERLQAKRRRALRGVWAVEIESVLAEKHTAPKLSTLSSLATLRQQALSSSGELLAEFDRLIADEIERGALEGDGTTHLSALAATRRAMAEAVCTPESLARVDAATRQAMNAVANDTALPLVERFSTALTLRVALREARFDEAFSADVDAVIVRLSKQALPALTEADARSWVVEVLAGDAALYPQHPSDEVQGAIQRVLEHAASRLLEQARTEATNSRWTASLELTDLALQAVSRSHEGQAWRRDLLSRFAADELGKANTAPALALVHRGMARFLGARKSGFDEARKALSASFEFHPALAWPSSDARCAPIDGKLEAALSSKGETVTLNTQMTCSEDFQSLRERRTRDYVTEVRAQEMREFEESQVVQKEWVRQEQCTRRGATGTWSGVCEVRTPYTTTETVKVKRLVDVVRQESRSLAYDVQVATRRVSVVGTVTARIADGTTFVIPIDQTLSDRDEAWDYHLPPEKIDGAPRRETSTIASNFTLDAGRASVATRVAREIESSLARQVQAHRARLALERGRVAVVTGDVAKAGHEFALAALHVDELDASTHAFWRTELGLDPRHVSQALLTTETITPVVSRIDGRPAPSALPALPTLAAPSIWRDTGIIKSEGFDRIFRGHDGGHFRARLLTHVQRDLPPLRGNEGGGLRVTPSLGITYAFGIASTLLNGETGWGFRLYDELELASALGLRFGDGGVDEGRLSYALSARYALGAGYRFRYLSLFVGARVGRSFASNGDVRTSDFHLEPFARLALRLAGPSQLVVQASALRLVPGMGEVDSLLVRVPLFGRDQFDLVLSAERWRTGTTVKGDGDGERRSLGELESYVGGAGIGIFW